MQSKPQTVLITGANRGLGLALCRRYLQQNDQVIATCRQPDRAIELQSLAQEFPLTILPLDVTDTASRQALAQKLCETPIDILINNAGLLSSTSAAPKPADQKFGAIDPDEWTTVLQTNSIAPVMVTQTLLPNLRRSTTRKIAMISSRHGSITEMDKNIPLAYGTSKAALNAATKILSSALQDENFIVVTFNPGWMRTDMGGPRANLSPEASAARLVGLIDDLTPAQNGNFLRHTGETLAW
ncbi:MAG: SDR family oxidoreductase [Bdellovibrionales bacterium]